MTLMPEFRRQLLEAAATHPPKRGWRRSGLAIPHFGLPRLRLRLGAPIAATLSILVVVVVVAVVFTIGGAHHGIGTPGGRRDRGIPSVATARTQLIDEVGALRHGYASKLAAHLPLPVPDLQIDRSLVRTVQTRGYTVTLIPASYPVHGSVSSRRTTGLVVTVQGPHVHSGFPAIDNAALAIGAPVSPAAIASQGAIIIMYVSGPLNRAVVIVPDGVTRVQLSRLRPDRSSSGGRLAVIAPASSVVHDNVAVISLPDVTTTALHQTQQTVRGDGGLFSRHRCRVTAALYFVPVSARMTWWRETDTGSEAQATTVHTSLNAYSTTLLPSVPCRRSRNR